MAEITAGNMTSVSVEQHIEDVMKQVPDGTLVGANIVNFWEHPTHNESYALARLDTVTKTMGSGVLEPKMPWTARRKSNVAVPTAFVALKTRSRTNDERRTRND